MQRVDYDENRKKLKILMVCEAFGGGVFTYVSQLCNDMCDVFDIYLAYAIRPQTPKNYKDFLDKRICMLEVKHFGTEGFKSICNIISVFRELKRIEKEIQPDIIHLHSSIAGGIGRLAFNGKKSTVVYTPHGYAHILQGKGLKSKLYKIIEIVLGRCRCITLTCCESENLVARTLCKETAYIETGVNLSDFTEVLDKVQPISRGKFTVFTLGRVCVQKQPELFNRIAELVPEAQFLWIGNGPLEKQLTAANMTITGWKPRKEALAIAKGADVFILCSLGEAIAMSLIENMYMKKLVLVSNVIGNKSVIQNGINGYVCNTAEEYAKRIRAAMIKFPAELPEKAYEDVVNVYNTKAMKEKYIKFYNKIEED